VRNEFSQIIERIGKDDEKIIFMSGDLGYKALEGVQEAFGDRFINMGVAEQSMISAAAGMAHEGYKVFCYSIAPFIVYRCLEQTRNDVCFHNLPVFLIGNGGGYGYGIMGSSHHAIEDLATLRGLPNMNCYVPSFIDDLRISVNNIISEGRPAYLRLGLGKKNPYQNTDNSFFKKLTKDNPANKITVLSTGPVTNNIIEAIAKYDLSDKIDIFLVTRFPFNKIPESFFNSLSKTKKLLVVEEHISVGGLAQQITFELADKNFNLGFFQSLYAKGYPNELYGNQTYHQKMSGLDIDHIGEILKSL
jgi:transketolase